MPVILANSRWQSHVPYVVSDLRVARVVRGCIDEINVAAGRPILKKADPHRLPRAYLDISGGYAQSESIGYKEGPIKVSAGSKRALIHEILHALGFCHEQYHRDFAWSVPQPDVKRAKRNPKRYFVQTAQQNPWNKFLIQAIEMGLRKPRAKLAPQSQRRRAGSLGGRGPQRMSSGERYAAERRAAHEKRKEDPMAKKLSATAGREITRALLESPDPGPEPQFMSYLECLSNPDIIMSDVCDYDSIMMYSYMAQAAYDTQQKSRLNAFMYVRQIVQERERRLSSLDDNRGLSPGDAQAIRRYIAPDILRRLREGLRHKTFTPSYE